ncbi:MAG TPA: MBL fold metallo-hydrolase [Alphaproteobacteria bacterium]|nr:MBL fold metallo-hydrolase [Alphaproteobacteria bacterium]
METASNFFVRFWGVRGSIPTPGATTARYGGNTSCLEVRCGDRLLIFDAGTGIRPLGAHLDRLGTVDADVYFTHTHVDHIQGLPFFSSAYKRTNKLRFWAGHLKPDYTLKQVLSEMMMEPLFPVPISIFGAEITFNDFDCGQTLAPVPGIQLRTAALNHPNRATAYRIEYAGKSICYVTDTEHKPDHPDTSILALIEGADLVIYDSTYTDQEFPNFIGWGHSTWQEGVRLCTRAKVGRLVIFHHDPSHDDAFMDKVAADADKARPGTIVAREGLILSP